MIVKKILQVAVLLGFSSGAALAQPFEMIGTKVENAGLATNIRIDFFVPQFTQRIFIRIGCELFDANEKSLGKYVTDFSSSLPYRPLDFVAQSFQRPVMSLPSIQDADHAKCKFATVDDPLPTVSPDKVEVELLTTHELHLINHSHFHISSVKFDCVSLDGRITTQYEKSGLGLPPGYVSPRQHIPEGPMRSCTVKAVQVSKVDFWPSR